MHTAFKTMRTALLTASLLVPAAALARPMTAEDVAKLEAVGAVAVSPDGSRVAYTTSSLPDVTEGEKDGSFTQELKMAYGPDNALSFLPDDISPSGVTFSPDGRMVSFVWAKDDEDRAVWGIPVDGGAQRKLAAVDGTDVRSYAWSPDSGTIYMLTGAEEDDVREDEKDAGFTAIVYEEEFKFNRLFRAAAGREVDTDPVEITVPGYVSAVRIAPDGQTAVIDSAPTPLIDDSYTSKRAHIFDLATGTVRTTIETPGKLGDVEISPDGAQLSMIAGVDMHDPADTTLHLVDTSTGQYRALNAGAAEAAVDAEWLSDGRLASIIHIGADAMLRIYNADGSVAETVDPGDLILTGIQAGGDRVMVWANSPAHPTELYEYTNGAFTRWTNHNTWLSEIDMGTQRTVTYTATDGQEVEGILIEPVGGAPAGGAPTIMMVHGGPEAHYSNGWLTAYSMPGQMAAGEGYAVFHPNYRGSTGYGVDFAKQHQGRYTDPEFRDIVDAKKHLVAEGITDPDRTGITGGSYGGYASAWGATHYSDEYAAAVMFVGISNQTSKFGTGDIPFEMYNVHSRAWPWDDWQKMLEVSPIYYTDRAKTPLLIMHGLEDTRVDPGQSYELYRFVKIRNPDTPLRMVLYPGEGHGNRKAASRYDYNKRMLRWFETYLKTGDRDAAMPDTRPILELGGDDE
ncbi:S9 family peptidase [Qipengyuania sp. DSG2-2]|uniref:S9 family peptidase n=1 Tax=Qipengyuania sp. DGS2-2 TaxID=3349631 RepID=UPI0036D3E17A